MAKPSAPTTQVTESETRHNPEATPAQCSGPGIKCTCDDAGIALSGTDNPAPTPSIWDTLPEPIAMPTSTVDFGPKTPVTISIPAPIRRRAEISLGVNTKALAAAATSSAKRPRIMYQWDVQPVDDVQQGHAFVKLMTRYAKYRPAGDGHEFAVEGSPAGQVTARCGAPCYFHCVDGAPPQPCAQDAQGSFLGVRYSVRPFEARKDTARIPATESS